MCGARTGIRAGTLLGEREWVRAQVAFLAGKKAVPPQDEKGWTQVRRGKSGRRAEAHWEVVGAKEAGAGTREVLGPAPCAVGTKNQYGQA